MGISSINNDLASQVDAVKNRLRQLTDSEREQFRNIYYYRWMRSTLRSTGQLNIFCSLLTIWLALSVTVTTFRSIQLLVAILMLGVSIWVLLSTSVQQLRAFMGIFLLAALYNLFVAFYFGRYGISIIPFLFGLAQLWWTFCFYRLYQRFRAVVPRRPSEAEDRAYDNVWQTLKHSDPSDDSNLLEFSVVRRPWRGWLLEDFAIVAPMQRKVVLFVPQQDAQLVPNVGKLRKQKRFRMKVKFDDIRTWGAIRRSYFDRYAAWKQNHNQGATPEMLRLVGDGKIDWLPFRNLPLLIRILLLLVLLAVLGYIISIISLLVQYHQFGL